MRTDPAAATRDRSEGADPVGVAPAQPGPASRIGAGAAGGGAFTPVLYRVDGCQQETDDVTTLDLRPVHGPAVSFRPGQFNMLTAFGVGEVAVSVSSAPDPGGALQHTVRDVGPVTHALCTRAVGDVVGLRGAFGTDWGVDGLLDSGQDVVVVAGGIGLAPLRGALQTLVTRRRGGGRLVLLVGARTPDQIVFGADLERWRDLGAHVGVTVDIAAAGWRGHVGVVTTLLPDAPFDPARTVALMCGPEVMMRFAARDLVDRGVDPARIRVSLERNMQCGIGLCGHCQMGPLLVCRDGPVVAFDAARPLLEEREL